MLTSWKINETRVTGKYCEQAFSGVIVGEISGMNVSLRIQLDQSIAVYGEKREKILMDCKDANLHRV